MSLLKNKYEIRGKDTAIFINCKGKVYETLISTSDLPRVKEFPNTWFGCYSARRGVVIVRGNLPRSGKYRPRTLLTRWILKPPGHLVVDHINHNTLDNRRSNLRAITHTQNQQNRKGKNRINETSRYIGVHKVRGGNTWVAHVTENKRRYYLGSYDTEKEAHEAVVKARRKLKPYSKEATLWISQQ